MLRKYETRHYKICHILISLMFKFALSFSGFFSCRCFFTIEYGKSTLQPHFNLLLERQPKVYDNVKSLDKLFNKVLPNKALCLWKNSSKVQQIDLFNNDIVTLNKYINKENNYFNQTIPINVNDYVKSSKKNCKTKNNSYVF